MTLDQMISRIDRFGESLNDLQPEIEAIRDEIVSDLKGNAPVAAVNGGGLRSSIRGEATSNSLTLYMNDYGFFQNYGVNSGNGNKPAIKVPRFGISEQPRSAPFYAFKGGMFGIKPNRGNGGYTGPDGGWFSIEQIKEEFGEELGSEIIARTF